MSNAAALPHAPGQSRAVPRLLIALAFVLTAVFVVAPLVFIFWRAFAEGWAVYLKNIADPMTLHAIWLTSVVAVIVVPVNIAFGIAAVLVCIGMAASFFLTKRDLARRDIPRGPIFTGAVFGLVGGFVVPVLGIFLGFALGLFLAELYRVRDAREAATSSWVALKSFGTGILVEFSCALLATGLLATSILTRFL